MSPEAQDPKARIGIVTVSDRASRGEYEDRGGPAIREYFEEILTSKWSPVARVISDDQPVIEQTLKALVDDEKCCLVVTTGGTGPARRDVTPEATASVLHKLAPGIVHAMTSAALAVDDPAPDPSAPPPPVRVV